MCDTLESMSVSSPSSAEEGGGVVGVVDVFGGTTGVGSAAATTTATTTALYNTVRYNYNNCNNNYSNSPDFNNRFVLSHANNNVSNAINSSHHQQHVLVNNNRLNNNNNMKNPSLKRVSFGSSKGSMVETLIYDHPLPEEDLSYFQSNITRYAAGHSTHHRYSQSHPPPIPPPPIPPLPSPFEFRTSDQLWDDGFVVVAKK